MRLTTILGVIGAILMITGLGFGFTPTQSSSGDDCGSPFRSNVSVLRLSSDLGRLGDLYAGSSDPGSDGAAAECQAQQNIAKPLAILLLVVGLAAGFGALVAMPVKKREEPAPATR